MLSFFPRDVLDEILNLIESVSEGFPSYFSNADAGAGNTSYPHSLTSSREPADDPQCNERHFENKVQTRPETKQYLGGSSR